MHLESEEDKKVGKLFEDTKYTGLIAKLKRDGIPSYTGNQVTICIPSPTISSATPFSAGTFIPGSSQAYGPSGSSAHAPTAAGTAAQGAGGHVPSGPGAGHITAPGAGGNFSSASKVGHTGAGHTAAPGAGHTTAPGAGAHFPSSPGAGHTGSPGARPTAIPGAGAHTSSAPGRGHTVVSSSASPAKFPGGGTAGVATPTPVPAKTNVVKSITYEWAPPGINQSLVSLHVSKVMLIYDS